ncbi:hypothetical protein ON010_g1953 [Phytophthora cinnamomi]|nr:hypothetical protein ON010_g1953 [Phytophthora cinnamomi]
MRGQSRRGAVLDYPAAPADDSKASRALQPTCRDDCSDEAEPNATSAPRRGAMPVSDNEAKDGVTAPPSHRAVDALRQSPLVEMHHSSSGRNLRL